MSDSRFYVMFERHLGFGVWWDNWVYPLELSFSVPFVTLVMCFGKRR